MRTQAHNVGIYTNSCLAYSQAWVSESDFPEKDALRELGLALGCDNGNPFGDVVKRGDHVVVKPNWVRDFHPDGLDIFSIITHPSILRAVVDLIYEAMEGDGRITIADAPQWDCDFDNLLEVTQVERIVDYFHAHHNFPITIRDLRQIACVAKGQYIQDGDRIDLPGDPNGYAVVDLGQHSAFIGMPFAERMYGADYDRRETIEHHNDAKHEYLVAKTILDADVVVHVPKLKVHKKVGVTLNAKGMVGINGNKNWIAHYRIGPPSLGGDEFPDTEPARAKTKARIMRFLTDHLLARQSKFREAIFRMMHAVYETVKPVIAPLTDHWVSIDAGDWYGNDTAWRMSADLARAVLFADATGKLSDTPQRRFYSIVDGIVAGECEGPLHPTPKPCGTLIAGSNLLAVDLVATRLMGMDWRKVKTLEWLVENASHMMGVENPAADITVLSNSRDWVDLLTDSSVEDLSFQPHSGWVGHLELDRRAEE